FAESGGILHSNDRWRGEFTGGVVRATGRRLQTEEGGNRWLGLKIHARNVPLMADLEMHLSPRGYVGLCRINGGAVNVCGLFRRTGNEPAIGKNWRELLCSSPGSPLHERLTKAVFDEESFCSVAGLALHPHQAGTRQECSIGDAITMIPPVTGN